MLQVFSTPRQKTGKDITKHPKDLPQLTFEEKRGMHYTFAKEQRLDI